MRVRTLFKLLNAAVALVAAAEISQQRTAVGRWRDQAAGLRDHAAELLESWRLNLPQPQLPQLPRLPQLPQPPWVQFGSRGGGDSQTLGDAFAFVCDGTSSGNGWNLVFERDGVRVWRRKLPGSPYDEVRGNGLIKAPPRSVTTLLPQPDEETIRQYNPMYDSGHDLQHIDSDTKVSYGSVRAIFPFKPRDTVTRVAVRELPNLRPAAGTAILQNAVVHPEMPPRSGYVRAEILRGVFLVQNVPRQPKVTNFTFTQQVNAGGIVPAWLMNTLIAQDAIVFVKRIGTAATRMERRSRV